MIEDPYNIMKHPHFITQPNNIMERIIITRPPIIINMEDDLNGRPPQWKRTSMEDDLNGRRPQ